MHDKSGHREPRIEFIRGCSRGRGSQLRTAAQFTEPDGFESPALGKFRFYVTGGTYHIQHVSIRVRCSGASSSSAAASGRGRRIRCHVQHGARFRVHGGIQRCSGRRRRRGRGRRRQILPLYG